MGHGSLHLATAPQRCASRVGSYFPHPALQSADLHGLIAFGGEALQLPENVAATPFGVGNQPGQDLLPLPFKGVLVGTSPAQDAFSPLLLAVQDVEFCCRIGDAPLARKRSCRTMFDGKDAKRCRWWAGNKKRATDSTAEQGLL